MRSDFELVMKDRKRQVGKSSFLFLEVKLPLQKLFNK